MLKEIKRTENQRNKDEKALDPLGPKLRVADIVRSPRAEEKVSQSKPLDTFLS